MSVGEMVIEQSDTGIMLTLDWLQKRVQCVDAEGVIACNAKIMTMWETGWDSGGRAKIQQCSVCVDVSRSRHRAVTTGLLSPVSAAFFSTAVSSWAPTSTRVVVAASAPTLAEVVGGVNDLPVPLRWTAYERDETIHGAAASQQGLQWGCLDIRILCFPSSQFCGGVACKGCDQHGNFPARAICKEGDGRIIERENLLGGQEVPRGFGDVVNSKSLDFQEATRRSWRDKLQKHCLLFRLHGGGEALFVEVGEIVSADGSQEMTIGAFAGVLDAGSAGEGPAVPSYQTFYQRHLAVVIMALREVVWLVIIEDVIGGMSTFRVGLGGRMGEQWWCFDLDIFHDWGHRSSSSPVFS
ncbi:hypothetical protein BC835DRAFT_1309013 [Cytidiella melzeri]|nr:hypothetical protein BC835DRAFT_1309013 [Cytidiella melzeri]